MVTDRSGRRTTSTGAAGSPIGCQIASGSRDGVVGGLPVVQSTAEGQRSGKWRKGCRRMVEGYMRIMRKL